MLILYSLLKREGDWFPFIDSLRRRGLLPVETDHHVAVVRLLEIHHTVLVATHAVLGCINKPNHELADVLVLVHRVGVRRRKNGGAVGHLGLLHLLLSYGIHIAFLHACRTYLTGSIGNGGWMPSIGLVDSSWITAEQAHIPRDITRTDDVLRIHFYTLTNAIVEG